MNLRLGIIVEVFKGGRQIYIQMKAQVLPFQNNISILNSANSFIPWRDSVCTSHSFNFDGVLSGNNTIQRDDQTRNNESTVGYNFRSFQGWPTNLYSNESLGSPFSEKHINFEFGQFLHTIKCLRVRFALLIQLEDQNKKYESTVGYNFRSF